MRNRQLSLLFIVTIFAMIVSAISPVGVRADDATPPPESTGITGATPPPENNTAGAGVDVVITDAQGKIVPLTSSEGENALLNGQPVWCPDGVTPDSGGDSCSTSFASISDLLSSLNADSQSQQEGAIYIQTDRAEVAKVAEMPSADVAVDIKQENNPFDAGAVAGVTLQNTNVVVLNDPGNAVSTQSQDAVDGTSVGCPDGVTPDSGGDNCPTSVSGLGMTAPVPTADPPQEDGTVNAQAAVDPTSVAVDATQPSDSSASSSDTTSPVNPAANMTGIDVVVQGTDVMVVNNQGQETPLVEDAIANGGVVRDPIWCPDGITPTPGSNGCTSSFTRLDLLVAFLTSNQPAQNGTIWIQQGADASTAPVVIDGSVATTWANYALTLQGGWNGAPGNSSITGSSTFSKSISITTWLNNVTLNDLSANNTTGTGINVSTTRDIALNNVSASGNNGGGAVLDNCVLVSSSCTGTGSVSVTGTNAFNGNGTVLQGNGLEIDTTADISLNNITANNNADVNPGAAGLGVSAHTVNGKIVVTGQNTFSNNESSLAGANFTVDGGSGVVQLNNLTASGLPARGVRVVSFASGKVSIFGTNLFTDDQHFGLTVFSGGDIYVENISANNIGGIKLRTYNGSVVLAGINNIDNTNYLGHAVFLEGTLDVFADNLTVVNAPLGDGIVVSAGGNAKITCSSFTDYALNGLETGPSGGYDPLTLTLNNVTFSSSSPGATDYVANGGSTAVTIDSSYPCSSSQSGNPTIKHTVTQSPTSSGKLLIVNVVNLNSINFDSLNVLDCTLFSATTLVLPNGDSVTYACPIAGKANLLRLENNDNVFPGILPGGYEFLSAMSTALLGDGGPKNLTNGVVTVSFVIPADMLNANLTILYWDGSSWVDLSAALFSDGRLVYSEGVKTAEGRFETTTNFPGVFVLVKK